MYVLSISEGSVFPDYFEEWTIGKLINRVPGSRLLIQPSVSTCVLEAEPGKLDINKHSPSILYVPSEAVWLVTISVPFNVLFVVIWDGQVMLFNYKIPFQKVKTWKSLTFLFLVICDYFS